MMTKPKYQQETPTTNGEYVIWFDLYDGSTPLHITVKGLANAREAWDRLTGKAGGSTRP